MEELIQRITAATGLEPEVSRQAVGMILGFIKKHAPEGAMGELLQFHSGRRGGDGGEHGRAAAA